MLAEYDWGVVWLLAALSSADRHPRAGGAGSGWCGAGFIGPGVAGEPLGWL